MGSEELWVDSAQEPALEVDDPGWTYRGICKHGKARVLLADDCDESPQRRKEIAREVYEMMLHGLTVDRVTAEVARQSDFGCRECRSRKSNQRELL